MAKSAALRLWASELLFAATTWNYLSWQAACEEAALAEDPPNHFKLDLCVVPDWIQVLSGLATVILLIAIPYFTTRILNDWPATGLFEKVAGAAALVVALPSLFHALFMLLAFINWAKGVVF